MTEKIQHKMADSCSSPFISIPEGYWDVHLPLEGNASPRLSLVFHLSMKNQKSPQQRKVKAFAYYTLLRFYFEEEPSLFLRKLRIPQATLSSVSPGLCPVLYCYIHSRTDVNFWVICLCFKFLMKLTYTFVKNHNNPSIRWLSYCSWVFFWGLGNERISPLHRSNWHLQLMKFINVQE